MLAVTLAGRDVSPSLYQDALILQNLAMSLRSDACAVVASCDPDRNSLPERSKNDAFWAELGRRYKAVAAAIGDTSAAARDISVLTPKSAVAYAFDLVGRVASAQDSHIIVGENVVTPALVKWLDTTPPTKAAAGAVGRVVLTAAVGMAVGAGVGYFAARRAW